MFKRKRKSSKNKIVQNCNEKQYTTKISPKWFKKDPFKMQMAQNKRFKAKNTSVHGGNRKCRFKKCTVFLLQIHGMCGMQNCHGGVVTFAVSTKKDEKFYCKN